MKLLGFYLALALLALSLSLSLLLCCGISFMLASLNIYSINDERNTSVIGNEQFWGESLRMAMPEPNAHPQMSGTT